MALPTSIQYGQVKWHAVSAAADGADVDGLPDAVPVTGIVAFKPSVTKYLSTFTDPPVTVFAATLTYSLDADGVLRDTEGRDLISLVATDSTGITPTGWTWQVSYNLMNGTQVGSFSFALPAGSVVDLTTVAPVGLSNGAPIIQGPKGDKGDPGPPYPLTAGGDGDTAVAALLRNPASATGVALGETGTESTFPNTLVRRDAFGGFAAAYIYGLGAPGQHFDAANKGYVDAQVAAVASATRDAARPKALGKLYAGLANRQSVPARIAFTGSSTTEGALALDAAHRYVNRLVALIQAAYPSGTGTEPQVITSFTAAFGTPSSAPGVHAYNAGQAGAVAADYLTGTEVGIIAALNPVAVIHMIGSNDFANGVSPAAYKANVQATVNALNAQTTRPLVQVLIHTYQRLDIATPAYSWASYGQALAEIASADPDNLVFVDLSGFYQISGVPGGDPFRLLNPDKVHQTDAGYALMADLVRQHLDITPVRDVITPPAVLVRDGFARANAASLGTAETGQTWEDGGAWSISGNQATATGNGHAFIDLGTGDMDVSVDVTYSGGNAPAGVQINATDANNRVILYLNPTDSAHSTVVVANFGGAAPGVAFTGVAGAVDTSSGQTHRLRMVSKGAQLTAYLDGTEVWTYTMTTGEQSIIKARTKAGMRQSSATALALDNFVALVPA